MPSAQPSEYSILNLYFPHIEGEECILAASGPPHSTLVARMPIAQLCASLAFALRKNCEKKRLKKFRLEHLYLTEASISFRIRHKKHFLPLASYSPALHWGKNAKKRDWDKALFWTQSPVIKAYFRKKKQ